MPYPIAQLNSMAEAEFVGVLGEIFEHTPAIAQRVWPQRPFTSLDELHQQMAAIVLGLERDEQLALIRAHPELGSTVAMASASVQEQAGVGLHHLTPEEFERFQLLNRRYRERFGFPFIIAVKHHTKSSILEAFAARLTHSYDAEVDRALGEIIQIARVRLHTLVQP